MPKYRFDQIAFNSTEKKKPVDSDKYTYIGLEHLDAGSLTVTRYGAETAPVGDKLVMKKGDVLFGKRRAYQKKVAIAPFDGIFSAHGMVLRPKDVIDKSFFPFFIASDYFLDAAIKISVGSLSPTINWRDLARLEFELPDLETQAKLAEILTALTRAKEAYENLIKLSDDLVKSQFVEMFAGDRYPLYAISELLTQMNKSERITDTLSEKYVTVSLYGKGVRERSIEKYDPKPFSAYRVTTGQFIYSRIDARNGAFGIIPETLNGAVVSKDFPVFYIDRQRVTEEYLMYSVLADSFIQQIKHNSIGTTNRQRVSEEVFMSYKIKIPSLIDQNRFVAIKNQADKSKFVAHKATDSTIIQRILYS